MKHVLIYPVKKGYLDPVVVSDVAKKAESAGFYAFLSWDHYMLPDAPDTFDAWSPNHDDPVSYKEWLKLLSLIEEKFNLSIILTKECGQGNCAVLTKQSN